MLQVTLFLKEDLQDKTVFLVVVLASVGSCSSLVSSLVQFHGM
jgi:hypothetical protein